MREKKLTNPSFHTIKLIHVLLFFVFFTPVEAKSLPPPAPTPWPTELSAREDKVHDLINRIGDSLGATKAQKEISFKILKCENKQFDPEKQSDFITSKGEQEPSFGLAQIHQPSHPDISADDARDPIFSIRYVVENVKAGNKNMWTCGRSI